MSSAENLSLEPSLDALVTHLVSPLLLSPPAQAALRSALSSNLARLYAPTWQSSDPNRGSAFRSLIALGGRLPRPMREAADQCGVEVARWEAALSPSSQEWQVWCDPGRVSIRDGCWEWEDGVFFLGGWKDTLRTVWAAPSPLALSTTPRLSHAITIRSPCAQVIPASPLPTPTTLLTPPTPQAEPPLPPLSERPDSPLGSESSASTFTSVVSTTSSSHPSIVRPSHGHSSSISSVASHDSSRTRSTSPSKKPSVTAYDGGKVGVLGGGVKLGGGPSAPTSPKKQHSAYTSFNHHLAAGGQQQQRGRKMTRQPGLFATSPNQHMGPPPMGLFAYRG